MTYASEPERTITSITNIGVTSVIHFTGPSFSAWDYQFGVVSTDVAIYNGVTRLHESGSGTANFFPNIPFTTTATGVFNRSASPTLINAYSHGLDDGALINILGTTSYNGTYNITVVDANSFTIDVTFAGDESASMIIVSEVRNSEPAFTWQTRDNRENTWNNQIEIPLGLSGDCKLADPLRNTGRYRSRQHRIIHQDDSEFVLNRIYEKVSHE